MTPQIYPTLASSKPEVQSISNLIHVFKAVTLLFTLRLKAFLHSQHKTNTKNTYLAEIEEFSLAILENREPINNSVNGLQNQKVISACYLSAKNGKTVNI
jgi:predicted dehydrogenase